MPGQQVPSYLNYIPRPSRYFLNCNFSTLTDEGKKVNNDKTLEILSHLSEILICSQYKNTSFITLLYNFITFFFLKKKRWDLGNLVCIYTYSTSQFELEEFLLDSQV